MRIHAALAILAAALLTLTTSTAAAQKIIDFEDHTLPPNSEYIGADSAGGFQSGGAELNNYYNYDPIYGPIYGPYWEGWSYSNVKDNTTPGNDNQYAAYVPFTASTGAGSRGSNNYAVAFTQTFTFDAPVITLPVGYNPVSVRVANDTYTALSMLLGGPLGAKQFGGPSGTDPDFLQLTITGKNAGGVDVGHVDFKLADYSSANNSPDKIVDQWQNVNLSSLQGARELWFTLTSSDNNAGGMLTPAYFALDDLSLSRLPGDLSDDGLVDISDIQRIAATWLKSGPEGDANGDGIVDISDVQTLAVHWTTNAAASIVTVPEPATITLAILAALGLAGLRRATKLRA